MANSKTEIAKAERGQTDVSALHQYLQDPEKLKDVPVETLERLVDLHMKLQADAAKKEFYHKFNAVQEKLLPVAKKGWNPHTKSSYALAEDIVGMIDPLLIEHGFSRSISEEPREGHEDRTLFVLVLRHLGGHVEKHYLDAPIDGRGAKGGGVMTPIQGKASSYTYAERHLLCKVMGVMITEDVDGQKIGNTDPITADQLTVILDLINETKSNKKQFTNYFKVDSVEDLPQGVYQKAVSMLEQKKRRQESE